MKIILIFFFQSLLRLIYQYQKILLHQMLYLVVLPIHQLMIRVNSINVYILLMKYFHLKLILLLGMSVKERARMLATTIPPMTSNDKKLTASSNTTTSKYLLKTFLFFPFKNLTSRCLK